MVTTALLETAPDIDHNSLDFECRFREKYEIDSIDLTSFLARVEKAANIRIESDSIAKLDTLDRLLSYLSEHSG